MNLIKKHTRAAFYFVTALVLGVAISGCSESTKERKATQAETPSDLFSSDITGARVLVFTKTGGWRHDSIPAGVAALEELAAENQFTVVESTDASLFNDKQLREFNAIVFLNTTLNVLDEDQELAMERFIQAGGGFVGIHAAADTEWEGNWHWYRRLLGGVFAGHPSEPSNVQTARLNVVNPDHPATADLPVTFELADEWYDFRDLYPFRNDLLTVDEKTYFQGQHGDYHPITWYHDFDGGRSFYTALGHTSEIFADETFRAILLKGLRYAVGGKPELNYSKVRPENNRFIKKTMAENLNEPMSFDFFANGDVLIAERPGTLKWVKQTTGEVAVAAELDVAYHTYDEIGLLGVAINRDFEANPWVYIAYNHQDDTGQLWQRLARFDWADGLNKSSEKVLLQYKIDANCCHTGGDLEWGENGELFFSTGDNTNPHEQNGFSPIDFREGNTRNDALRGAGNTQDLRGKIMRIIPQPDGTYTIPEGNLFSDPQEGRPEIYVMGARNPFTIAYDKDTGALYYGDVGPDANQATKERGPRGHDEFNRVTEASNMGWPLFMGNNQPYVDYNFETEESGRMFDPLRPINKSPRNTGASILPPAKPALIWYPYGNSEEFPEMGSGGRMAMVADVYRSKNYPAHPQRYPEYYDGKLFILEAMRGWIKAVSLDEHGRIQKIEPFAPQLSYTLPTDARFGPDGTLYVLEYGRAWFKGNPDAVLTRVEFVGADNRAPEPVITLDAHQGAAPMQIEASALASADPDGDALTYQWSLVRPGQQAEVLSTSATQELTFDAVGSYVLRLTATDTAGVSATTETTIDVGNAPADIAINIANQSFFWPGKQVVDYAITVSDQEDGVVSTTEGEEDAVQVSFRFQGPETEATVGHQTAGLDVIGKELVTANACTACHQIEGESVGPSYRAVADRYKADPEALAYLINKISTGGSGVWGANAMPGFSHLSEDDLTALATYVLSLATEEQEPSLSLSGKLTLDQHQFSEENFSSLAPNRQMPEFYELAVSYTDKGGAGIGPITVEKTLRLVPARVQLGEVVTEAVESFSADRRDRRLTFRAESGGGQWRILPVGDYDLTGINVVELGHIVAKADAEWEVELRVDAADGRVIAAGTTKKVEEFVRLPFALNGVKGHHKLFIAVRSNNQPASEIHLVDLVFKRSQ